MNQIASVTHDGSHVGIKLPRKLVRACKLGKPSSSFSHENELDGMRVHVYCTSDKGIITNVLHGIVKRASKHGVRRWIFVADRSENMKTFNTTKLSRL